MADEEKPVRTIGIVGAGSIGTGLCVDLLLHGLRVVLVDVSEEQLERARASIPETVRLAPMLRRGLPKMSPEDVLAAIDFTSDLAAVADCEFVVENVTEEWETKRAVYRELDEVAAPGARFGVNTSSIPIGKLAAETGRADRIVGTHFMNPPYLKDAVEVVRAAGTSHETLDYVRELFGVLGKEAIVVDDHPGFVSNRISHLFFNEAARVVEEQGVNPATVDRLFKKCFGHPMGPLETADLIGLDTVALTLDSLHASYGDAKFACAGILREMIASGRLGRKSGEGFYKYA
ncbi:MAG TPA: 3-hydroxyacyl-CoA dehydrogenase family protein [Actinomycetota bacterium]|nr:3-hydroxyacyl-CoA dehydrogenase family protein [Actinomycetota bacterium]